MRPIKRTPIIDRYGDLPVALMTVALIGILVVVYGTDLLMSSWPTVPKIFVGIVALALYLEITPVIGKKVLDWAERREGSSS
jgi:hypothetical protein